MPNHWTPTLSEKGSEEVLKEQGTREVETTKRRSMLARIRDAVRSLHRDEQRGIFGPKQRV